MKIYLVGGAVRDQLLNLPVKERDWVVIGATVADMQAKGYRQVGKEFPVFLHPKTNEEYALGRKERKTKPGYKGFEFDSSPDVTLEEDLERRDLTINAIAQDSNGNLIDPFHGAKDIHNRVLRHVSSAFPEDPVRILRVGRFLARFAHLDFYVAQETNHLMQQMVHLGEVDALVPERVWKELSRALTEKNPEKFFEALANCDALPILFPEINKTTLASLIAASKKTTDPLIRFAAMLHGLPENEIKTLCNRLRTPNAYSELATLTARFWQELLDANKLVAEEFATLFAKVDVYRREDRFKKLIKACEAIAPLHKTACKVKLIKKALLAAKNVDVHELILAGHKDKALADAIFKARTNAIRKALQ